MGGCDGNCAGCSGCARELVLSAGEVEWLENLGQIPFLPIARAAADATPICMEDNRGEQSLILQVLEKKGLVSLDFDKPIKGFDYAGYPIGGSVALTRRGQDVLEMLERQGFHQET